MAVQVKSDNNQYEVKAPSKRFNVKAIGRAALTASVRYLRLIAEKLGLVTGWPFYL
jgi:hypothetical protein